VCEISSLSSSILDDPDNVPVFYSFRWYRLQRDGHFELIQQTTKDENKETDGVMTNIHWRRGLRVEWVRRL